MPDNKKDVKDQIKELFNQRKEKEDSKKITVNGGNYVKVNGDYIIDRRRTVIINQFRRAGDRITQEQQKAIWTRIETLAKWDAVAMAAYNPEDKRNRAARHKEATRKRLAQFKKRFRVTSFKHITQAHYQKAINWLDQAVQKELEKLDKFDRKPSRCAKRSMFCLVAVALTLALPLTVSQAPPIPDRQYTPALRPAVTIPGELPLEMPDIYDSKPNLNFSMPGCSTVHLRSDQQQI